MWHVSIIELLVKFRTRCKFSGKTIGGLYIFPETLWSCLYRIVVIIFFCLYPGKKTSTGGGGLPGGKPDQLPGNRHYHAGGTEALDVLQHPQG